MSTQAILDGLGAAVEALARLGDKGTTQDAAESRDEYSFQKSVPAEQIQELSESAMALLNAKFTVRIELRVRGVLWPLTLKTEGTGSFRASPNAPEGNADFTELLDEALTVVEDLEAWLRSSIPLPFADLAHRIAHATSIKAPIEVNLIAVLSKKRISEAIEASISSPQAYVVTFLSPWRLAAILAGTTPKDLDNGYFSSGRRTAFVVPGMRGVLANDLVIVCGRDGVAELEKALADPLSGAAVSRVQQILAFCDWQCDWPDRPRWLSPEALSLPDVVNDPEPDVRDLRECFNVLRSVLSILFLARRTRRLDDGRYEVRFGDAQEVPLLFAPLQVTASPTEAFQLFGLYNFAYEGFSTDKLELVRQFLAFPTRDLAAIFRSARNVVEVAGRAHGRYLKKKVDEYFEAQRKTRDYVQGAVRDSESSVVKMTQDVAESVYKTFGAVALVVVAQALDTKLTAPATLLAAVVLSVYLGIVLFYYLPTARRMQRVRKLQYADHINSFQEVLGEEEIGKLLENERVKRAWEELRSRRRWAAGIYTFLFVAALLTSGYYARRVMVIEPLVSKKTESKQGIADTTPARQPTPALSTPTPDPPSPIH